MHGFVNAVGLGGRAREATAAIAAALRAGLAPAGAPESRTATLLDAPG